MLAETKQTPIYGGGTATWVSTYNVPFTVTQKAEWLAPHEPKYQVVIVLKPRIANLHAGTAWMSDDFDEPLPEDFLTSGK